jgi:aspartyl protease family protein
VRWFLSREAVEQSEGIRTEVAIMPVFDTHMPYFVPALIGGLVLLIILLRLPFIGALIRTVFTIALLGFFALLLIQRAPYDPTLARLASRFQVDGQEVVGDAVRIRPSPDGHYRATVSINGVRRRMLIDSGATVTALSVRTAREAGLQPEPGLLPIVLKTANGMTPARTSEVEELRLGNITARGLKVVVSPSLGDMDLLGMNFLSKLKSWGVEDGTLILVPHHPQEVQA